MLLDKLAGEDVCPEAVLAPAEGDLELDLLRRVALLFEEIEGVLEDL